MARSKTNLVLAMLLFNAACPAAGASVMRVHSNGEVEMVQTDSATGLADIFSDDLEAKSVASTLLTLAHGKPSDELLTWVQKLKKEIQPWHASSEAQLEEAIKNITSCAGDMKKSIQEAEAKKDICSEKSSSHTKHRKDENTKYNEKVTAQDEKDEKETIKTTTCTAFDTVKVEAEQATAAYVAGDVGAYLESVSSHFCDDLTPRYKKAKQECTTATAEFRKASAIYVTKTTDYKSQKTTSDTVQTQMDENCCAYAVATKNVCTSHDACYKHKVEAYEDILGQFQAEEKVRKVEWRVYSRIECLLPVLGTNEADKIEECRVKTHNTDHLNITNRLIPAKSTCPIDEAFPGTDAYYTTHFGTLPENAKGKDVQTCTGMGEGAEEPLLPTSTSGDACKAKSTSTADAGYSDSYRGWYDVQGCGKCLDYCRWVGNSGSGGDPKTKLQHGTSWWSCRLAGGSSTYSWQSHFASWAYTKCKGEGAEAPLPSGSNMMPPTGYVAKSGSGPCRCRGSGYGLDSCGKLCCKASPYTDPDPAGKYYYKKNNANAVREDALCYVQA